MKTYIISEQIKNFTGSIITDVQLYIPSSDDILTVKGLWDTGSTFSSVSNEIVEKYNLKPIGETKILNTTGQMEQKIYELKMIFGSIAVSFHPSGTDIIHDDGFDILIGMDIIACGDFVISSKDNEVYFFFRIPSQGKIDF